MREELLRRIAELKQTSHAWSVSPVESRDYWVRQCELQVQDLERALKWLEERSPPSSRRA